MKIKFIKDYRLINADIKDTGLDTTIESGEVNDFVNDESAQWLIDNGFAEEVKGLCRSQLRQSPSRMEDYC